jgi:hypothetical protein
MTEFWADRMTGHKMTECWNEIDRTTECQIIEMTDGGKNDRIME